MKTAIEVARAWAKEACAAADGPRLSGALGDEVPDGMPRCDCMESLARVIDVERAGALERAALVVLDMDPTSSALRVLATRIRALKPRPEEAVSAPDVSAKQANDWLALVTEGMQHAIAHHGDEFVALMVEGSRLMDRVVPLFGWPDRVRQRFERDIVSLGRSMAPGWIPAPEQPPS